jgi:hypothetical protein
VTFFEGFFPQGNLGREAREWSQGGEEGRKKATMKS